MLSPVSVHGYVPGPHGCWLLHAATAADSLPAACGAGRLAAGDATYLIEGLLTLEPYAKHREQLAADPALQQAVADALLQFCLPALAAAMPAAAGMPSDDYIVQMLYRFPGMLRHPCLVPAIRQRLRGPAAPAAVQAAAAVVEALPVLRPAGMAADVFLERHTEAALLLHTCTTPMVDQLLDEQYGSGSSPAAAGPAALPAGSSEPRQQAAWRVVALVPRLTNIVQALADDPDAAAAYPGEPDDWTCNLNATCGRLSGTLHLLRSLQHQPATPAQLGSWAAAAAAGLRLQPLLLRLDASWQQRGLRTAHNGTPLDGVQRLSAMLLGPVWRGMPTVPGLEGAAPADSEAEQRSLALRLWELHTAVARLCHFFISRSSPRLAGSSAVSHTAHWAYWLAWLERSFHKALAALLAWRNVCDKHAVGLPLR